MDNGYEAAQQQRNWLERLGARIPGFKGYQDRELRRDVDRMQREHISRELGALKAAVRTHAREYADAGQIGALHAFDRLDRRLDGLSQSIRFTDYGASGLFDVVKIMDAELEKLYEFDLSLLEDVAALRADIAAIPAPGAGEVQDAAAAVQNRLDALAGRWEERKTLVGNVVQSSS
jgi:FtsZ-binding cell division protein ZapB